MTQWVVKNLRSPILILEDDVKLAVELMCLVADKLRPMSPLRGS